MSHRGLLAETPRESLGGASALRTHASPPSTGMVAATLQRMQQFARTFDHDQIAKPARDEDLQGESYEAQSPSVITARDAEINAIAADLVRDLAEPQRPAVQALALSVAKSLRRLHELQRALEFTPNTRGGMSLLEGLARMRELEDRAVQRGLLNLGLLHAQQSEQLRVQVRVSRSRRKRAAAR